MRSSKAKVDKMYHRAIAARAQYIGVNVGGVREARAVRNLFMSAGYRDFYLDDSPIYLDGVKFVGLRVLSSPEARLRKPPSIVYIRIEKEDRRSRYLLVTAAELCSGRVSNFEEDPP